jgi:ABC-type phosphate transport system permease subunit
MPSSTKLHRINTFILLKSAMQRILVITAGLLLIPFIGSMLTDEVNWGPEDYAIGGLLIVLLLTGIEVAWRMLKGLVRLAVLAAVVLAFALVWGELAVGIFGTPWAGS